MTLDVRRHTTLDLARSWTSLAPEERRRRAIKAARDQDAAALWDLTAAHLALHGASGARTSPHTLRMYRRGQSAWLEYAAVNAVGLLSPTADQGALWLRDLEASGKSTSTIRVYLAGTRALYRALRWADAARTDPFVDARPRKDATAAWDKRAPYPDEDVRRLLAHGDADMRALVLLGAHGGLRASEIVRLAWGDVDAECRTLRVLGKGGKVRVVSATGSLRDALRALERGAADVLVIGRSPEAARVRLKGVCGRAGVTYRGLHALRHTAGTRIVRAGLSLQHAARHLGHVSVATAEVYAKWADDALTVELERW